MKIAKFLIPAITLLAIGYLGFSSFQKVQRNKEIAATIQSMPAFSFTRQTAVEFTNSDIDAHAQKLIFSFFNPECEHCQYMAGELVKNSEQFTKHQVLMVTTADSVAVDNFIKTYQLNKLSNVVLLRDTHYQFASTFGARIIPSFFIYDEHRKLVKKFTGETKIENLLR
ncbi:MAG: redoxin domain-containing protein [Chitinophagaceae bacterium]